jgi:hypothetical protein
MSRPNEITRKLRDAAPELSLYVKELERINYRLQKKIAKLQADNLTKDNEIKAIKKEQPGVTIIFEGSPDQGQNTPPIPPSLPEAQPYQHPQPLTPSKPMQITK